MPQQQQQDLKERNIEQRNIPYIDITRFEFDRETVAEIPEEMSRAYMVIAMESTQHYITVAISNLNTRNILDRLQTKVNKRVYFILSNEHDVLNSINNYYDVKIVRKG